MRSLTTLWGLSFSVPSRAARAVSAALEKDALAVSVFSRPRQSEAKIEALYGREPDDAEIKLKLDVLSAALNIQTPKFVISRLPRLDWLKKVSADFPPLRIARWTIHGARHREKFSNRLYALQIDATNAFGTGEHPTTKGCLLMLDTILKGGFRPLRVADIGCGSGILALACLKAMRGQAVAVDLDPDSVQIAAANVRTNGFGPNIRVGRSRGYTSPLVEAGAPYDLILSNIFAGPLCQMAKDLKRNLKRGGIAILSGILSGQAKKVIAAHRMQGMQLLERRTLGEWSVLALKRPGRAL